MCLKTTLGFRRRHPGGEGRHDRSLGPEHRPRRPRQGSGGLPISLGGRAFTKCGERKASPWKSSRIAVQMAQKPPTSPYRMLGPCNKGAERVPSTATAKGGAVGGPSRPLWRETAQRPLSASLPAPSPPPPLRKRSASGVEEKAQSAGKGQGEERFNCLLPSVLQSIKQTRRMKPGAQ